jgi:hypothetical protein
MPTTEEMRKITSKSAYLNAAAVGTGLDLTIDRVTVDTLKSPGKPEAEKFVVWFAEDPRGWVLNVSSIDILEAMFGHDSNDWTGKRLTLHNDVRVTMNGKSGGIRVKSSPDIARSLKVRTGGNAFNKRGYLDYTIEKVADVDPLAEALAAHGLTTEQYDAWATANQRPPFVESGRATREKAADWIKRGGHAAILRAQPKPATEPGPTPEPTPSAE